MGTLSRKHLFEFENKNTDGHTIRFCEPNIEKLEFLHRKTLQRYHTAP